MINVIRDPAAVSAKQHLVQSKHDLSKAHLLPKIVQSLCGVCFYSQSECTEMRQRLISLSMHQ